MRGPIKAVAEEILAMISVRECHVPLFLSNPVVRVTRLWTVLAQLQPHRPLDSPDKILVCHPLTLVFLVLSTRYLDWQERWVTPIKSISLSQEVIAIIGSCNTGSAFSCEQRPWPICHPLALKGLYTSIPIFSRVRKQGCGILFVPFHLKLEIKHFIILSYCVGKVKKDKEDKNASIRALSL
ncbi:hypothetical protein GOODEAATRI_003884 [Goodea atripinnis]|uniref:Uncharacterized protein n=1 Tax=Goodea atripinnis TaxID=208336 RepID=A0ABV0PB58_9TELE